MHADELGEDLDHSVAADAACHIDRQRLARELIDDGEALNCWPLAHASNTKSYAHISPMPLGAKGRGRQAAMRRRGRFLGTCSPAQRHRRCTRYLPRVRSNEVLGGR